MPLDHKENIVEVKNVSFSYGENEILKNINFNIHRGDYLGIVGSNGSGKTTLLKIILGLLEPSSGSVRLFGLENQDFKNRSKIGYVPQKVTNFDANFPATVMEVVLMGRYAKRGLFRKLTAADRSSARQALEQVEMEKYEDRLIGKLSEGQQQRVFIARALATEPEIIFLDEPTAGVDQEAKDDFYALLKKLNLDLNLTVILITHDIESIAHEAMHVACLDKTLFFYGSSDDFLKEKVHSNKEIIVNHRHNA